jgi:hypothetical protein
MSILGSYARGSNSEPAVTRQIYRNLKGVLTYDTAQDYRNLHSVVQRLLKQSQNFEPSPYLKASSNKVMTEIKPVGTQRIFHCTKLILSKCNG